MEYTTLEVMLDARGILTVALNRPEIRNAFDEITVHELLALFERHSLDPRVRAVVLKGNGPIFCCGADLNWMARMAAADHATNFRDAQTMARTLDVIDRFPKPVLGVVQGGVYGGAIGMTCVCDVVLASADTMFRLSDLHIGLVPACIMPYLMDRIGESQTRYLILTARRITADHARQIGLVHEVVPHPDALPGATENLIQDLLECGPEAVKETKHLIRRLVYHGHDPMSMDTLDDVAHLLAQVRESEEAREGMTAFRRKSSPPWAQFPKLEDTPER